MLQTNQYLVATPSDYIICNDIRHTINSIKGYCYRLNTHQLQAFNALISRHIKRQDWRKAIKKQKYIINADIYGIKLDAEEIKMFF